jgi:hypothetical protein
MEEGSESDEDVEGDKVTESDVEGDDDDTEADGNGDQVQQGQFQTLQEAEGDGQACHADGEVGSEAGLKRKRDDEREDEVSEWDSAEGAERETGSEYDDNLSELSESEKEDDDDFVPQARRAPSQRQSTFRSAGRESPAPYVGEGLPTSTTATSTPTHDDTHSR